MVDRHDAPETWVEYKRLILAELERLDRVLKALEDRLQKEGSKSQAVTQSVEYLSSAIDDVKKLVASMQISFDLDIKTAIDRAKEDFAPYKLLLNGFIGMVLTALVAALVAAAFKAGLFVK